MLEIAQPDDLLPLVSELREVIVAAVQAPPPEQVTELVYTAGLYQRLVQLRQARELYCRATGRDRFFFDPETPEARSDAFAMLGQAVTSVRAGHPLAALRSAIAASAMDPEDQHSQILIDQMLPSINGPAFRPPAASDRSRFQPPAAPYVANGRSFIAVAEAGEIIQDHALLRGWSAAFSASDDVTLAIVAPQSELDAAIKGLQQALVASGLGVDTEFDLAIVPRPAEGLTELARDAHARLTDRGQDPDPRLSGLPQFGSSAADVEALRELATRRWSYTGLGRALQIAIKIPAPNWGEAPVWGDTFFALQFARELKRRGHHARLDVISEWDPGSNPDAADDVVIQLRGPYPYVPQPDSFNVLWNISRTSRISPREAGAFDLIGAPSARCAEELQALASTPVIILPQATDPANCWPEFDPAYAHDLTFVANTRGFHRRVIRQIMADLLPTTHDVAVWGAGWNGLIPDHYVRGESIANDQLRRAYSSASIVLNDHMPDQHRYGIVNNRIYDVLACGGCVLSDYLPELEDAFSDIVATYQTPDDLRVTVDRLLADPAERAERGQRGRELVLRTHTFSQRADLLLSAVATLL
jgi:hypothetical protein